MKTNNQTNRQEGFSTVIITAVISVLATLVVVALVLVQFGTEKVADEVSPFVETAKTNLAESLLPPTERTEPKTEADLILEAISRNQGSSVLIYKKAVSEDNFVARGLLITTDGVIITDEAALQAGVDYVVAIAGKREVLPANRLFEQDGLAVLKTDITTTQVARFSNDLLTTESLVAAINGTDKAQIATGIINAPVSADRVTTNIVGTMVPGAPVVSKAGFVIGIATAESYESAGNTFRLLTKDYIDSLLLNTNSN